MSVSSSRRYSLSASSTPARKAPSAIDRPTACISAAIATTSSSDAAVKISGVSLRAIQRSSRAQQQPAAEHDAGDHADDLRGARASRPPPSAVRRRRRRPAAAAARGSGSPRCPGTAGSQKHGLARWSSAAGCARPARCSAIAVDDSARPSAATSATRQSTPPAAAGQRTAAPRSRAAARCPSRRSAGAGSTGARGSSSRPTRNSISTTPNSAKCRMSSTLVTSPRPHGPITMPAAR